MILPCSDAAIAQAAQLIRDGQPVAVPTETVYGLAADATDPVAVARIYEAKGRPAFNPLIVHVADRAGAEAIAGFSRLATALADAFWPGPLTLVLPARAGGPVCDLARAGLSTVAVRMSAHPAMQALIHASARPLAAPSANRSGGISPTTAAHVAASLGARVPLILDAGSTSAGLESTIVAPTDDSIRLLRPGPVTAEMLGSFGLPVVTVAAGEAISAPGQLASHYAPAKPLRQGAVEARPGEWLIGFGAVAGDDTLSASGDLVEAASTLFAALHRADATDRQAIAVAPVPHTGLGVAINDRLARAAVR